MFGFFKGTTAPPDTLEPRAPSRRAGLGRAALRMFEGASADRLTASWPSVPLTADDVVRRNQRVLVARSREQAANNDYGKAFLRMCRQNIVGPHGIRLQAQARDVGGSLDNVANDAIEMAWHEWGRKENCDVAARLSWRSLQALAVTSVAKDGEFMFRKVYGRDGGPWGFALQALDPQRCPVDYDEERRADGTFIRHGIRFNQYGRALSYLFTTTEERDADYGFGGRSFVTVSADEIIHGYLPDMVGQKRGLPWMTTSLWRMKMLHGYEQSALVNARVSAAKGGFFKWQEGYGPEADEEEEISIDVEPGAWQELPAGVDPVPNHPPYPVGELAPFRKEMLRAISAGMGVAYNNLANDLEGVNFSSIRQGALDEREYWKEMQEWLIETLVEPVFMEWLPRALLAGRIVTDGGGTLKAERIAKYRAVQWQARRWQWIDPRADVASAIDEKNNLLGSFGGYIRDQGRDPQSVWREIAQDIQQMRNAGIPEAYILQAMGRQINAAPAPGEGDPPAAAQA